MPVRSARSVTPRPVLPLFCLLLAGCAAGGKGPGPTPGAGRDAARGSAAADRYRGLPAARADEALGQAEPLAALEPDAGGGRGPTGAKPGTAENPSFKSSIAGDQGAIPPGLECLRRAYPDQICGVEPNRLLMCDGTRLVYDDGRPKSHAERLREADLQDMMAQKYPAQGSRAEPPAPDFEPGRVRSARFFRAIYGETAEKVQQQLVRVRWLPSVSDRELRVTSINGVSERLKAVSRTIERLPLAVRRKAAKLAGGFAARKVKGTERPSAHAWGIAVDVAADAADYWRWREPGKSRPSRYRNRVPLEIVEAFEREGFIWGGRWYRYDTMHFEYRPELLLAGCRQSATVSDRNLAEGITLDPVSPGQTGGRKAHPALDVGEGLAHSPAAVRSPDRRYLWAHQPGLPGLQERFPPPESYRRVPIEAGSFGWWLRDLPLRPGRGQVHYYNGALKGRQNVHEAVIDIDVGRRDLQQCADAVMRLRAEYLFSRGRAGEICFRAASGPPLRYRDWRRGLRPPRGRAAPWSRAAAPDSSHRGFRRYLDRVFGIANTASLRRELWPVADPLQVKSGDVFIESARGGVPGHAVLVVDVAENPAGERVMMLLQSYMPAQDMHLLGNLQQPSLSPWYRPRADGSLHSPEWSFPPQSLRRFGASCAQSGGR